MRVILPSLATLVVLCAACSDSSTSTPLSNDVNREAVASVVGGVTYPLVVITPAIPSLKPKDSATAQAKLTDANGSWKGKYMTWKSSDTTVLKIKVTAVGNPAGSTAHFYALKAGTVSVTATTQSNTIAKQAVTVSGSAIASSDTIVAKVSVSPNPIKVASGKPFQLSGVAYNASGTVIPTAKLAWRSTNAAIVTVSSTGMVSGIAKGTANVEAAAANGKMAWSGVTDTGGVAAKPPTGTPTPPGTGVPAVWSDKFVSSIGIGTHFSYWDLLPYGNNLNSTLSSLKGAGFRWIRDGLFQDTNVGSNDRFYGVMNQVKAAGIKMVLVTQPAYLGNNQFVKAPYTNQQNLDTAVKRLGASAILAFEGPNEVDNNSYNWGGVPAFGANAKAYQAQMYQHAKQIAPGVTVIGLTTTSAGGASYVGDISSYMDAGTLHPYPSAQVPTADLQGMESRLAPLNAAHKGWWVTETGYYTAPNATQNVYQPGVTEAAQAKYAPRLYLDYFNAGISHTSIYELIDEHSSQSDAEANYGILRNDGSQKPAYASIKNLISLLSDPGAAFTPTATLGYTLAGTTGTIRQALFQKRDGRFYLVLWNDVTVFNTSAKRDVVNAAVNVVVSFATQPRTITRYQPASSASGASVVSAKTITVAVPDSPVILEITQ